VIGTFGYLRNAICSVRLHKEGASKIVSCIVQPYDCIFAGSILDGEFTATLSSEVIYETSACWRRVVFRWPWVWSFDGMTSCLLGSRGLLTDSSPGIDL
jgi:hypothetical protein